MAEYGIEVRDANGNIILDNSRLTRRLWLGGVYKGIMTILFDEPLDHEPAVVVMGVNKALPAVGAVAVKQNGQYVGVEVNVDNDLVLVFAKE